VDAFAFAVVEGGVGVQFAEGHSGGDGAGRRGEPVEVGDGVGVGGGQLGWEVFGEVVFDVGEATAGVGGVGAGGRLAGLGTLRSGSSGMVV
jgi:hypothetical protein